MFTKKDIEVIKRSKPKYKDIQLFLHCKTCIPKDIPLGVSAKEYGNYEIASCKITVGKKKSVNVMTIWCKWCGRLVWDSRHLTHLY